MKIRIAGRPFKVIFQKPKNLGACANASARIIGDMQKIWIDKTNAKGRQQSALLHELIHAVDNMSRLGLSEEQTEALANGLLAILRDNPTVVKALAK